MRVVLVSDVHLGGPGGATQARFLEWIRGIEADHLCLCGDVFDVWWHWGTTPFAAYAPVVDAIRDRGLGLTVLPGNHDFLLPRYFGATDAPILPSAAVDTRWDGLRVHLAHGDHVDRSVGYRALTGLLRGRAFGGMVDALGPDRAWPFLRRLSGDGALQANPALVAAQIADARRILGDGSDLVVFGHTHAPGLHRFPEGTYLNLGDWVTHRTWGRVEDGEVFLEGG